MAIDMPLDGYALLQEYRQRTLVDDAKRQAMQIQAQEEARTQQMMPLKYAGMNMDLQKGGVGIQQAQLAMEKTRRDMALADQQRAALANLANIGNAPEPRPTMERQPALSGVDANGAEMQGPQEPKLTQQPSRRSGNLSQIGNAMLAMGKPAEAAKFFALDRQDKMMQYATGAGALSDMPGAPRPLPQKQLDAIATDAAKSRARQTAAPERGADALRDDVYYQIMNGVPRPGSIPTGRQGEGNAYRAKFADELNKVASELGKTPQELATMGKENKAKFMALGAVEKDLAAIRPYNDMLHTNGDIAIKLGEKAIATDSKLLNKPLNWVRQNAGDNPDVAEFLAQAQIVSTESARVLNNPRLVGQLTDSARHEMQGVISGDMPINSFIRVVKRMQADGNNRVSAMEAQRARTVNELRGSTGGKPATTPQAAAPTTGTAPAAALDYLKANPDTKDAFKAKFGYLPAGM